ncbi:hypothetical protein M2454_002444 [Aequitasia blattaphilus]
MKFEIYYSGYPVSLYLMGLLRDLKDPDIESEIFSKIRYSKW